MTFCSFVNFGSAFP
jgi:hypothetical protein